MSKNTLIVKNTIFLATRTIISIFISLYTTRVVLHQLGANDYGLFSVIYGIVGFTVFLSSAMNESVQRYISMALGRDDLQAVKDTIKNSILIYILVGLAFVLVLFFFKHYVIYSLINIPGNSYHVAEGVYSIVIFSIFLSVIQTPFNAVVIAHEKMSFYAYMSIFDVFSKLLISFLISFVPNDKVFYYSLFLLGSSFITFCIYMLFCVTSFKRVFTGGKISHRVIKDISTFSFWNIFGNFAYVCRTQGINISMNIFFTTATNAAYAISTSVLNAMTSLTQSLALAIRPQIFKSYDKKDIENRFDLLILFGSKYTYALLFFLSCPILLCTKDVLALWLINVPDSTVIFVRLILSVALIDSLSSSIIAGIQASGRIKIYQIVVGFMVFLSLPLTYLAYELKYPAYSAFIILAVISIINLNLRLFFLKRTAGVDVWKYYTNVIIPCLISTFFALTANYLMMKVLSYDTIFMTLLSFFLHYVLTILILGIVIPSSDERKFVFSYARRKFK
ncbi:MATE family efflux transporter [Klebsiella oxytoca]|uniref:MATE family efflux transporter n=1 Tax=Klebsiella oxytoca TaxID=571 RepID=UPI00157B9528|nr:MATE family efflux transporter [Klebsiella oxytoca]